MPRGESRIDDAPKTKNDDSVKSSVAGHDKMVALLARIAERTPDDNFWLGDRAVRQGRRRVAALSQHGSPVKRGHAHLELGIEEARVGNERKAIEQFALARTALTGAPAAPPALANESVFRLGVAYMRLAETENCCQRNTAESCILPLRGAGIHQRQEAAKQAIEHFTDVLSSVPEESRYYMKARWLLNLAFMTIGGYPADVPEEYLIDPKSFQSDEEFPRFANVAPRLQLNAFNICGGAIVDDFDNNDYLDIITSSSDTVGQIHFYRNNGDGTFTDKTDSAGLAGIFGGLNIVQADYNNDGNVDVLALRGAWLGAAGRHPNSLLRNNGDGTFRDVTYEAGLAKVNYPTQTGAWADYDNDGDLDLYIGNEHSGELNAPSQLFRNNGDGTFKDVAAEAGVENLRFAKGVVWGDYNGDKLPDLYVSNLTQPNRLYQNNGDGTFTDVAARTGVARPHNSFPAWFWDFDNDGALDIYVSSYNGDVDALADVAASYLGLPYKEEKPRLFRGDGQGGFRNVAADRGLTRLHLPMGANFGDLDNDGWLDFYLGTGYPDYEALMPNVMYRNQRGDGFADVTTAGGFGHLQKGHGIAFADLDNDGDQDVFEQMGGNFPGDKFYDALFENPGFDNHWITIHLVGVQSNRSAIGARIHIQITEDGRPRSIYRHVGSGGSFGANPLRQSIGLGKAAGIDRLEVYWPTTGQTQSFENVRLNRIIRVVEGENEIKKIDVKPVSFDGPAL